MLGMKKLLALSVVATAASLGVVAHASSPAEEVPDPAPMGGVISVEKDQCGSILYVEESTPKGRNWNKIERGAWTRFTPVVYSGGTWQYGQGMRFKWRCGNTDEQSQCPRETKTISAHHSKTSREITWNCEVP
jgi:hypothetical protein